MFQNIVNKFFMVLSVTLAVGGLAFAFSNAGSSPSKANCCNAGAYCPDEACCPNNPCCEDGTCNSIAKVAKKVNCCPDGACCPTGPCCEVVKN